MNKNPYEVLGVARDASESDIKKAYHKLVMQYHPDKNPGDKNAEEKFKEVNNAFDILKDPQKRAAYDRFGDAAFAGGNASGAGNPFGTGFSGFTGGAGMDDILREAMRGFGFDGFGGFGDAHGGMNSAQRGRDLLDNVTISLKDAYFGVTHTVNFSSNVTCDKCNGYGTVDGKEAPICSRCRGSGVIQTRQGFFAVETTCPECNGLGHKISKKCSKCDGTGTIHKQRTLEVKIPAGVEDGTRLRLAGQGEAGQNGAMAGDFYLDIHIKPDEKFERVGNDLILKTDIPFAILAIGGEIEVETLDDKKLSVKIPSGTQIGSRLRLRGNGMPNPRRTGTFGDLYIEVMMTVPTKLTDKQKKALEEFTGNAKTNKKSGWF